jgi:hypothetical protein
MTKREVVLEALAFRPPPYVPWAWDMTKDCQKRLRAFLDKDDLIPSHSVPPDVPPENLVAMMEELRAQNEHGRACT